jgi:hypothetical protein
VKIRPEGQAVSAELEMHAGVLLSIAGNRSKEFTDISVCGSGGRIPSLLARIPRQRPKDQSPWAWVDAAHARFNTRKLRAQAREGKHFANELVLEARPMALFAYRYFCASPQVIITHVIGNQNYDGVVEDKRQHPKATPRHPARASEERTDGWRSRRAPRV